MIGIGNGHIAIFRDVVARNQLAPPPATTSIPDNTAENASENTSANRDSSNPALNSCPIETTKPSEAHDIKEPDASITERRGDPDADDPGGWHGTVLASVGDAISARDGEDGIPMTASDNILNKKPGPGTTKPAEQIEFMDKLRERVEAHFTSSQPAESENGADDEAGESRAFLAKLDLMLHSLIEESDISPENKTGRLIHGALHEIQGVQRSTLPHNRDVMRMLSSLKEDLHAALRNSVDATSSAVTRSLEPKLTEVTRFLQQATAAIEASAHITREQVAESRAASESRHRLGDSLLELKRSVEAEGDAGSDWFSDAAQTPSPIDSRIYSSKSAPREEFTARPGSSASAERPILSPSDNAQVNSAEEPVKGTRALSWPEIFIPTHLRPGRRDEIPENVPKSATVPGLWAQRATKETSLHTEKHFHKAPPSPQDNRSGREASEPTYPWPRPHDARSHAGSESGSESSDRERALAAAWAAKRNAETTGHRLF